MTTLSRLSPYNVTDDLLRSDLYKEIRAGGEGWAEHEIQPDEVYLPELVAYRVYGTDELKWVVLIAAGLDDMREALTAGETIKLPPTVWIREKIKEYAGDYENEDES